MKSEKGITLASLGIYIVVILIALITLSTITAYFRSNVNEFNTKTTADLEFDKFNLYFIEEVKKTNNKIDETRSSETKISFTSENTYEFIDNSIMLNENIKIAEKIENCTFNFSTDENNLQSITVYMKVGETERTNQYILSNQTTENVDNEDYTYKYKRVDGTNELTLNDSIKTNLKNYKIYGNSVQESEPTPNTPVEVESVGDRTKNLMYCNKTTGSTLIAKMEGSEICLNGSSSSNIAMAYSEDNSFILKPGTYTLSFSYISGTANSMEKDMWFGLRSATETWVPNTTLAVRSYNYNTGNKVTFTLETEKRVSFGMVGPGDFDNLVLGIQLEEGNTQTSYEPYGYKIPVKVGGKNLLKLNDYVGSSATMDYEVKNQTVARTTTVMVGTTHLIQSPAFSEIVGTSTLEPGTYIWSLHNVSGVEIQGAYIELTTPSGTINWNVDKSITLTETATISSVRSIVHDYNVGDTQSFQIQIEKGTSVTEYESYIEPITTNIYLNEPLRRIGDYADYIDFENGKVVRNVGKYILTSSDKWTPTSVMDDGTYRIYIGYGANSPIQDGVKNVLLCNYFTYGAWSKRATLGEMNKIFVGSDATDSTAMGIQVRIDSSIAKSVTEFKTFLDNLEKPLELYNPYSSPKFETIELPNIPTHKGINIIKIDTKIPPSNTEVVYYSK